MEQSFSIYNENNLHSSLKHFYSLQTNGKTEIAKNGFIYDIVTENNQIIEIQTKNVSKLHNKIEKTTSLKNKIKVIHPIITTNTIITTDENGKLISKRKSSKKENIYDILKEITGLYDVLLNDYFTLEIVFVSIIEHRIQTSQNVQSKNNKRRFKKNWIKENKCLDEIYETVTFKTKDDYLKLLPQNLPEEFTVNNVKELLKLQSNLPSRTINNINLLLWQLNKMNIISQIGKQGKAYLYKVNK